MKNPDQRVGVFIDVSNMYYSARALFQSKVNFAEILKDAVAGRKLIRAIAYVIRAEAGEENEFFKALEHIGIEVKAKDLQTFVDGTRKGDWDVGIAVDILKLAPKLDAVVLVSGDGDFKLLLQHAKAAGVRTEVMAFGQSASKFILEETDSFTDLASDKKYLLRPNLRPRTRSTSSGRAKEQK